MGRERKPSAHPEEARAPKLGGLLRLCTRLFCSCADGGGRKPGQKGGARKFSLVWMTEEFPQSLVKT